MKNTNSQNEEINYWTLYNNWLFDGSKITEIPQELCSKKCPISQSIILYHFKKTPYIKTLNKLYNTYSIYALSVKDILLDMKKCVLSTGYRPRFSGKKSIIKHKLFEKLKKKFPYLKNFEISFLSNYIDTLEDKETMYESFGISLNSKIKKIKKSKVEKEKNVSKNDEEENFVEEICGDELDETYYDMNSFLSNFSIEYISTKKDDDDEESYIF